MNIKDQVLYLSNKYNIKTVFIDENNENWGEKNQSWIIGNDEIWIGDYDNDEKILISFFHEVGHCLLPENFSKDWDYNTLIIELECWHIGINLAKNENILFSDSALEWGYRQALSYSGNDERESSSWEQKVKPTLWRYNHGTL